MKLHELKEKRNNIAKQMRALHDEIGDKQWTADQEKRFNDMNVEIDTLDSIISREERFLKIDSDTLNDQQNDKDQRGGFQDETAERRAAAFDAFLRYGLADMSAEQRDILRSMKDTSETESRAGGTASGSAGGYTVPTTFRNRIVDVMKQFGGVANISNVFTTDSGNPITWAVSDGTAEEGAMLAENANTDTQDITFGQVAIGAKKGSSRIVIVSNELLNDSGVDIYAYIAQRIGRRIGRLEAKQLITGDGTGNNVKGLLAQTSTGVTAALTNAIAYSELLALKHSVDPAYRSNPHWVFHDNSLLALKQLKDSQSRPLWLPSVAGATPATFDNDPYQIDQAMPTIATGKAAIAYGDFSAFQIRRVNYMAIKRLVEKFAEYDQTGFVAFHRFDCVLEDTAAVKVLKLA